jgi:two-component system, NtrC family, response regulator HydG
MSNSTKAKILIVDDDPGHLMTLETIIRSWGYDILAVKSGETAIEEVRDQPIDLILMDIRMAKMSGIEAMEKIRSYNPAIPVIIMTAYSSVSSAIEALKTGAYDYLMKPLDFDVLKLTMQRALEHAGLKAENEDLKARLHEDFKRPNIIGTSKVMKDLLEMLAMVAPSEATVLIYGESGTGKELIAQSLHLNSLRNKHTLVVVNCAALTESLLESELFGHTKGAFTGADRPREGRFMQAQHGTIFLDEIGETSPAMQAKLLRVLQEKEIQRVGSETVIPVDVRILAATNRDLTAEVAKGHFREDLYYRLNVVTLNIPPLRDRKEDIPLLAQNFMAKFAAKNRKTIKGFVPRAMDMLVKYDWPGNVRELENAIERAIILAPGEHITEKQLPFAILEEFAGSEPLILSKTEQNNGTKSLEEVEKEAIMATLSATNDNKSEAARRLGITRKTLHNKLKNYGIR